MKIALATVGLFLAGAGFICIGKAKKSIGAQIMGIGFIFVGISTML